MRSPANPQIVFITQRLSRDVSITKIEYDHILSAEKKHLILADSSGFIYICEFEGFWNELSEIGRDDGDIHTVEIFLDANIPDKKKVPLIELNLEIVKTFDLSENGAIWALTLADLDGDGLKEIITGGMRGNILCLSGAGEEVWKYDPVAHHCQSGIGGLFIWENCPLIKHDPNIAPVIVSTSLDGTIRVFDRFGKLLWSQMFASGVSHAICRDITGDGKEELIAAGADGTLRIFNGIDGEMLWYKQLPSNIRAITYIDDHLIYGGDDMELMAVNIRTRKEFRLGELKDYIWYLDSIEANLGISNTEPIFFIFTYSFIPLGMEDATDGHPFWGLYRMHYPENSKDGSIVLKEIVKFGDFNTQDYDLWFDSEIIKTERTPTDNQSNNRNDNDKNTAVLAVADTGGKVIISDVENLLKARQINDENLLFIKFNLPEFINNIRISSIQTEDGRKVRLFFMGCDKGRIYTLLYINSVEN